ncbi:hypothetical protein M378DRAFT_91291 [Amanita muscaria Koide BX008]|uniref:Uncharacterized protein n=1 Tax=Amanita muscaria (strain Koide BX008) TaxID=946122 RepID=A0A0C2WF15_AMAMK|nr:hypothetical protein M378DRAFT_91291 [Amanita muscaria Koide BX008]
MVNLLSTKLEMGAPMVCMYLLDHPDHYKSHVFVPFYWESYVNEAQKPWVVDDVDKGAEKVTLVKHKNKIVGLSFVYDYIYRPIEIEDMCLYDWVRRCKRMKLKAANPRSKQEQGTNLDDDLYAP